MSQDDREKTAKKLAAAAVAQGMDPAQAERLARAEVGLPPLPSPAPAPKSPSSSSSRPKPKPKSKPRARRRRAAKRAGNVVRLRRAGSAGALFAQSLGLVALYWVLRNSDAITRLTRLVTRGLAWFVTPPGVQST